MPPERSLTLADIQKAAELINKARIAGPHNVAATPRLEIDFIQRCDALRFCPICVHTNKNPVDAELWDFGLRVRLCNKCPKCNIVWAHNFDMIDLNTYPLSSRIASQLTNEILNRKQVMPTDNDNSAAMADRFVNTILAGIADHGKQTITDQVVETVFGKGATGIGVLNKRLKQLPGITYTYDPDTKIFTFTQDKKIRKAVGELPKLSLKDLLQKLENEE